MGRKKSKDIVPFNEELAAEVVGNVLKYKGVDDKRTKFFLYWILGFPSTVAAKFAGYAGSYAYKLLKKYRLDKDLRAQIESIVDMMPEKYRSLTKLRLVDIADIEGAALQQYKDNPELAIKKPQLLKHLKQTASVLEPDAPVQKIINIETVQGLMVQLNQEVSEGYERNEDSVIDVTPAQGKDRIEEK
jgi:hypothetical protein